MTTSDRAPTAPRTYARDELVRLAHLVWVLPNAAVEDNLAVLCPHLAGDERSDRFGTLVDAVKAASGVAAALDALTEEMPR